MLDKTPLKMFPLARDGLVTISDSIIRVTAKGKPFVRNICMAIDQYLKDSSEIKFSKTVSLYSKCLKKLEITN